MSLPVKIDLFFGYNLMTGHMLSPQNTLKISFHRVAMTLISL